MAAKHNEGSTLLLVIWMMSMLGVVATFLLYRAQVEVALVSSLDKEVYSGQLAEAVLHERLVLLGTDETPPDSFNDDWYGGGRINLERNGYKITVITCDEGSKPKINLLDEPSLHLIVPGKYQVNPILDWIDMDNDTRDDGAENAFYELLDTARKGRNGFISSLEELKAVKDCKEYFKYLEPEVTIFGKLNPNTVTSSTFASLCNSIGFDRMLVERIGMDFEDKKQQGLRFNELDDLKNLNAITPQTRDKLKPFVQFTGNCNVNMVSENGLKIWLYKSGYGPDFAKNIMERRKLQPFQDLNEFESWFAPLAGRNPMTRLSDYFVTYSTIIRYRIWVIKGENKYYLDTVQERIRDELKRKWKAHRLTWRILLNNDVPEVPVEKTETGKETSG